MKKKAPILLPSTQTKQNLFILTPGEPMQNVLIQNFVKKHSKNKKYLYNKTKIQV